jgi:hypothetical protein
VLQKKSQSQRTKERAWCKCWGDPKSEVYNRVFLKVILSSPPIRSSSEVYKVRKFYEIWVWNAETQHLMHKVRGNFRSPTCRSSENICRSSGGAQEKGKTGQNRMKLSLAQKVVHFLSLTPPWRLMYCFAACFWISPGFGPNSGFWCRVFLTLGQTLICKSS